jgi:hypothetical protein
MCSIIGWSGKLPKGLITNLLLEAESRGRDSVGIAYRLNHVNKIWRLAAPAHELIADKANEFILSNARRSNRGIAHTRRASPGMPINEDNAHPFPYWRYVFAHNGRIQNWREIKDVLINHFDETAAKYEAAGDPDHAKTARYCANYSRSITTDSMVLGPYIEARDFKPILGCMGLVWMKYDKVYTFRYAKEAVSATIIWNYVNPEGGVKEDHLVTIVASTAKIILNALDAVKDIAYDAGPINDFQEGHIFRVEPNGLIDEGVVPTNMPVEDEFSSETVVEEPAIEVVAAQPVTVDAQPTTENYERPVS